MGRGRPRKPQSEQAAQVPAEAAWQPVDVVAAEVATDPEQVATAAPGAAYRGSGFHVQIKNNGMRRIYRFGDKTGFRQVAVDAEEVAFCESHFERLV